MIASGLLCVLAHHSGPLSLRARAGTSDFVRPTSRRVTSCLFPPATSPSVSVRRPRFSSALPLTSCELWEPPARSPRLVPDRAAPRNALSRRPPRVPQVLFGAARFGLRHPDGRMREGRYDSNPLPRSVLLCPTRADSVTLSLCVGRVPGRYLKDPWGVWALAEEGHSPLGLPGVLIWTCRHLQPPPRVCQGGTRRTDGVSGLIPGCGSVVRSSIESADRRAGDVTTLSESTRSCQRRARSASSVGARRSSCRGRRSRRARAGGTSISRPISGSTISLNLAGCAVASSSHGSPARSVNAW